MNENVRRSAKKERKKDMILCDDVGKNSVLPIAKIVIDVGKVFCTCQTRLYQTKNNLQPDQEMCKESSEML